MRIRNHALESQELTFGKAQLLEIEVRRRSIHDPGDDLLTADRGDGRYSEIERSASFGDRDVPVLGPAVLGNIHVGHDLDA